ncbi:zinc finger bed domain-containing protein daysleeper [Quercus suber]|uniref:Zinc finger bed domain-containing protein daysleeper n=1 Tax=Quercus suber TaxID=58331 RepID=A0AAW0LPP9_QUESU
MLNLVNVKFEQDPMKDETVNTGNNNFDQRRSRRDLARMIILHGYPLAMAEHFWFRVFVKNLQPLFEFVTLDIVEADCRDIYVEERQKIIYGSVNVSLVCISDVW